MSMEEFDAVTATDEQVLNRFTTPEAADEHSGNAPYTSYVNGLNDLYDKTETSKLVGSYQPEPEEPESLTDKIKQWKDAAPSKGVSEGVTSYELVKGASNYLASATEQVANTALDAADFLNKELESSGYGLGIDITEDRFDYYTKKFENPQTQAEQVGKIIGQFVGPFAAVSKLSKAASVLGQAKNIAISSGISGMFTEANESTFAELIQANPDIANPLVEMFASNETDSNIEKRLKNMMEAALFDTSVAAGMKVGELVYKGVQTIKYAREVKLANKADGLKAKIFDEDLVQANEIKMQEQLAKEAPATATEQAQKVAKAKIDPEVATVLKLNKDASAKQAKARIGQFRGLTEEQQDLVLKGKADMDQLLEAKRIKDAQYAKMVDDYGKRAQTIDELKEEIKKDGRELTYKDLFNVSKRGKISDADNEKLAQKIWEENNERVQANLKAKFGDTFNTEDITAMKIEAMQSQLEVENMLRGMGNLDDASEAELAIAIERLNNMQGVYARIDAGTSEAARVTRQARQKGIFGQGNEAVKSKKIQEYIKLTGGEATAKDTLKAIKQILDNDIPLNDVLEHGAKTLGTKISDAAYEVWVNSVLSGFKTLFVTNPVANAVMGTGMVVETKIAETMGRLLGNGVVDGETVAMINAMKEAHVEALVAGRTIFKGGAHVPDKMRKTMALHRDNAISSAAFGLDPLSGAGKFADWAGHKINTPTRLLSAQDAYFSTIMQRGRLSQLAHRNAIKEGYLPGSKDYDDLVALLKEKPTKGMLIEAKRFSDEGTMMTPLGKEQGVGFGSVNIGGDFMQGLGTTMSKVPTGRFFGAFMRVGTNVADRALQRTPFSFLRPETRRNLFSGTAATAQEEVAKITVGTGVLAGFGVLAHNGIVTGGGPTDPKVKKALKSSGFQPYSIKIGNSGYIPMAELGVIGEVASVGADLAEMLGRLDSEDGNQHLEDELLLATTSLLTRSFTPDSLTNGVPKMFEMINKLGRGEIEDGMFLREMGALSRGLIPFSGTIKDVRTVLGDNKIYNTRPKASGSFLLDGFNTVKNEWIQTVGLAGYAGFEPELNMFGEEVFSPIGVGGSIKSAIFSNNFSNNDPVVNEIVRLNLTSPMFHTETLNEEHLAVRMPEKVKRKGIGLDSNTTVPITLSNKQYHDYVKLSAGLEVGDLSTGLPPLKEMLTELVGSDYYKELSDDSKKVEIKEIISNYKSAAWEQMSIQEDITEQFDRKRDERLNRRLDNKGGATIFGRGAN